MATPSPAGQPAGHPAGPLDELRAGIEELDSEIVALLARRMELVRAVAETKRQDGQAVRDDERQGHMFAHWAEQGRRHGLSDDFVARILREVLNYSRRDQERLLDQAPDGCASPAVMRVGFQGVEGAYSDHAIDKLFASRTGPTPSKHGYATFDEVLDALEAGAIDRALLPIENTIAGSIHDVYRLLADRRLVVVDEEVLAVEHCLAGLIGTSTFTLRTIRSHPAALQQCTRLLRKLEHCTAESHFDTAAAARSVAEGGDPSVAALCSEAAARAAGLRILVREVADHPHNFTRFLLIGSQAEVCDASRPTRTSLLLTVDHRQGALAECLSAFARHDVNLTKLESRPQPDSPWEYLFYIDIEGHVEHAAVAGALEEVRAAANHLRVLGSYPRRADLLPVIRPTAPPPTVNGKARTPALVARSAKADRNLAHVQLRNGTRTTIRVGDARIGPDAFTLIAGPCAVESRAQILAAAAMVKSSGAVLLRGGAFKPRSSPYSFQGLGFEGLDDLVDAGRAYELPIVTEVLCAEDVARIAERADMLQVGARNMQNFALLKELGRIDRPVLLKRGLSATLEELLQAAEYIMAGGNPRVVLCERGIRTFETATRNTLDVSAVPVLKTMTHLPVLVDPSHAAGARHLVVPLALAAVAAGADGLIVEAHPNPDEALCDKDQALTADDLVDLAARVAPILASQGRCA